MAMRDFGRALPEEDVFHIPGRHQAVAAAIDELERRIGARVPLAAAAASIGAMLAAVEAFAAERQGGICTQAGRCPSPQLGRLRWAGCEE